jgi:dephospho-CoA kinase
MSSALAVVGMAGAGKSEVTRLLVERHGFASVYFGQVVLDELAARSLEPGPDAERQVREELRGEEGMAVMAARSLPRIRALLRDARTVCLDGLYSGAEQKLLAAEIELVTVAVHAPRWLRKERLSRRDVRPLSGAELDGRDLAEVGSVDKATPIALADAHLVNRGTLAELERAVAAVVDELPQMVAARLRLPH